MSPQLADDEVLTLIAQVEELPHGERCTIEYSPRCDCSRGAIIIFLQNLDTQGD